MRLRRLDEKDAPLILEWMKDDKVNCYFRFNAEEITIDSVLDFIKKSRSDTSSYHYAVVDDSDEYLGTVSLKNIDINAKNAEYAIALRATAQGRGAGKYATKEIIKIAFENLGLERVYLNVLSDNSRAISFYKRFGFTYEGEFLRHVLIKNELKNIMWYRMMRGEYEAQIK